jgi:hypothetical protein
VKYGQSTQPLPPMEGPPDHYASQKAAFDLGQQGQHVKTTSMVHTFPSPFIISEFAGEVGK